MAELLQQLLPAFLIPYVDWIVPYFDWLMQQGEAIFGSWWAGIAALIWTVIKIAIVIGFVLTVASYLTLAERKIIGAMQLRIGPVRVGPWGLLQPVADGAKVILKEIVIPAGADKPVFLLAPIIAFSTALIVWAVIPFNEFLVIANINASLLYVLAIASLGVYGIILGGWSSNSKYSFLGSMRSAAQLVSYEIALGLTLVTVLMVSNSLNLVDIVMAQAEGRFAQMGLAFLSWNWLPLLPMFIIFLVSIVAETNRAPFDLAEGESEIIGYHAEYSGIAYAIFMVSEYMAITLCSTLAALVFLGGWLSPITIPAELAFPGSSLLRVIFSDGILWLFAKVSLVMFLYLWVRATFPRYRYDQVMRLGWKVFIPICLFWIVVVACWMMSPWSIWSEEWLTSSWFISN